jgi:hypothetical protein
MLMDNREEQRASVIETMELVMEREPKARALLKDWDDMHEHDQLTLVYAFLRHCAALYYNDGRSPISDAAFDALDVSMRFLGYPAVDFQNCGYMR